MPTHNVNLTPALARFVKKAVTSGAFNNASEVHRAALAAMAKEYEERELRIARLRQEIEVGLASGRPKAILDVDAFIEQCGKEALGKARARR